MSRPTWDETFLDLARIWAKRATCLRGQFGCVFVGEGNQVLASGYNGAPRGMAHCTDTVKTSWADTQSGRALVNAEHYSWGPLGCLMEDSHCVRTVHAEVNGVIQAARTGVSLLGSRLYVTGRPCQRCSLALIQVGVVEVIYPAEQSYHTDSEDAVLTAFKAAGVSVRLLPAPSAGERGGTP